MRVAGELEDGEMVVRVADDDDNDNDATSGLLSRPLQFPL